MAYIQVTLTLQPGTASAAFAHRLASAGRCDWFRDLIRRSEEVSGVALDGRHGPVREMGTRRMGRAELAPFDPRSITFVELLTDHPDTIVVTGEFTIA